MLLYSDIIKEEDQRLREKCVPVPIPLSAEDQQTLELLNEYLVNGYDETMVEKYGLRSGVGIAAPQIGVLKQMFVVMAFDEEGNLHHYGFINPKIVSHSVETVYMPGGEGCLSVERNVTGLVHRPKRVSISADVFDFQANALSRKILKFQNYLSIIVQHEYDHLSGILFFDRIDKFDPFFVPENSHPIQFCFEEETKEEETAEKGL